MPVVTKPAHCLRQSFNCFSAIIQSGVLWEVVVRVGQWRKRRAGTSADWDREWSSWCV